MNTSKPVLVTGATGYVAGLLVKGLLEEGITVHAAVRNPDEAKKLRYLNELAEKFSGNIVYFKSDLLEKGSYKEAMEGCEVVFHTASPFIINVADPQKELIEPALMGTRNVLEQANVTESVKRVVLTSSCAAIYGDNIDVTKRPDEVLTEESWNTSSSETHQPYSYSKTLAEKEAWKIAKAQNRWDLVVINPCLVIGPGINPHATSESFRLMKQFADGTMRAGVPDMALGVVDVRDVAKAHMSAGFNPDAKGRYIACGHNTNLLEMAKTLQDKYGKQYPLPTKNLPKWLVMMAGPWLNKAMTREVISNNVGYPWKADNSKSIQELGMTYRPMADSMNEFFEQIISNK